MIHAISAVNRHLYEDVLDQHFRLRHDIFVEERSWETLRKPDCREIDSYDNEDTVYLLALEGRRVIGGHRLYPTTKPSMMSEVFPHLAAVRGCPADPLVWEWSRYFVVRDRRDCALNLQLMAAVQEFCLGQGIFSFLPMLETRMNLGKANVGLPVFRRILQQGFGHLDGLICFAAIRQL